jgi:acetyltransferase-like isoleucine patch superfamily enzyme
MIHAEISKKAKIGSNVRIGQGVKILGSAEIGDSTHIEDGVVIGYSYIMLENQREQKVIDELLKKPTKIGANCKIGAGSRISAGAILGNDSLCEFDIFVGVDCRIGENAILSYRAQIYDDSVIGDNSWISGFISDRCNIGNGTAIFGKLVHKYNFSPEKRPMREDQHETSPTIEDLVVVGHGAIVIGVNVGKEAYVAAGAIVTKDILPGDIVAGNPAVSIKDKVSLI